MRRAALVITLAVCAAGCGSPGRETASAPPECERLTADQVIGEVPRDYEVAPPAEPEPIDAFVDRLRKDIGKGYRGYDASILGRRSQIEGTVVVVINTTDASAEDVVAGAKSAEEETGIQGERLDIAGQEGRLQRAADGSYIAMAPAGECSVVMLLDMNETRLRDAAALIGARS